jgi:hypothetical protein
MPNQPGYQMKFDYQETPGVNRTAWATESRVAFPGQHDSEWMVKQPNRENPDGPYQWLTYQGTDAWTWKVRFHCESGGGAWGMNLHFETERTNGDDNHDAQWIGILDWDGHPWKVFIDDHAQNPYTPQFRMERQ